MKLPEQLPTDPDELEKLYNEYAMQVDDFDEAEFQRLMDARIAAWGIDPKRMTADQILSAMTESVNSMLTNLYSARESAPDEEAAGQMEQIIKLAEQLRGHIDEAVRDIPVDADKDQTTPS